MLVLSRHIGQSVLINGEITITVLGYRGHAIRLGFEAPDHVAIDRTEVAARRRRQGCPCVGRCTCDRGDAR